MNFMYHPEKARIQRWIDSGSSAMLGAKYGLTPATISLINRSLAGTAKKNFSSTMEWRVLNAVRLYEAEVCGGVKPALAEIKTAPTALAPAAGLTTPP